MNENAFASIVQARPCPTFGRPVHLRGSPHRLRPGTSPHAFRIPHRDGHPALRRTPRKWLQVRLGCLRLSPSCPFRLLHTFLSLRPARHYPRLWIRRSSSERRRDFNPPDLGAAQRTLQPCPTPAMTVACRDVEVATLARTGLPRLPEPPFQRAVPTTPADRAGARVDCFPAHAAFPKWQEGRHPHCHFRGLLRLHSRYGPPDCSAA